MSELTAYFDCFAGACGSMLLGSLIDCGLSPDELSVQLQSLNIDDFELKTTRVKHHSISATLLQVQVPEVKAHRHLKDVFQIIEKSTLSPRVRDLSCRIFRRLAVAEGKIHNISPEKVHFHETGALDAIVDIVGTVLALEMLGVTRVVASPLNLGHGSVKCEHGLMPVPAPATAELLKDIPVYSSEVEAELTTPTGAAILAELAETFERLPQFQIERIGYGAGEYELPIPNLLRVMIGKSSAVFGSGKLVSDTALMIETNIDDMNPQYFESIFESLYGAEALEVFLTPTIMKKNRPGFILSVLIERRNLDAALKIIFFHSTTIGVRIRETERLKARREIHRVETEWGPVRVKLASYGDELCGVAPEYDDCRKLADQNKISVKKVYEMARLAAEKNIVENRTG